ncbi:adenosylcobalamin-dependent ribonucleoside-diphosphate reductase [Candidatus Woesearchaeota archaeon]|nr:adenosylcobalamin-dependent ribonucleoside-diphosphate reductase [Candidatus Woesearchaeota archaeon]
MVDVMPYDERRMRMALVASGIEECGLEDYVKHAGSVDAYYGYNDLALDVFNRRYRGPGEHGPLHMWDRVARAMASVEIPEKREQVYTDFLDLLLDFRFVPGGRIMHGAGRTDARRQPTLSNCYVIPIEEDSLEGIYHCIFESAMVYRSGGGVGTDLSVLRPKGAPVNATFGTSPGSTAFMNLLSESTNTVSQAGRRGALMLTLRVDHPDVYDPEGGIDFITIKDDPLRQKVQYANVSVLITDEFMQAVEKDGDFDLRWGGKVYRTVRARDVWDKIIRNAHVSAEPGIIFWDTMKSYHNVEYANPLVSTNPCGEQALAAYTACNLGNLNLISFVREDGTFDYDGITRSTRVATRFLDDVIDYNMEFHALPKIREAVASDRRVGLGATGLADALVLMGLKYDSEEALVAVEKIMRVICCEAYRTSIELAREKGSFSLFDRERIFVSKFIQGLPEDIQNGIREHGLRNSTLITMPPVGTGSIVAQTSSGIEPIFCTSYTRRVKQDDGSSFREYKVYHPLIRKLFDGDENLPQHVVTAHQIDPFFRVRMQGVIQRYVDSSVSSTINLPEDTPVKTIADIYIQAYKQGLKGVTVYREGSRQGILETAAHADAKKGVRGLETRVQGDGYLHPAKRPAVLQGITERVRTGEGNVFVTLNYDPDDELFEVFSTIGKAGGNAAAQSEAISRLISLALRSHIDPADVIAQLKGIGGPSPVWENGVQILSTPDAIGKAIERDLIRRGRVPPKQVETEELRQDVAEGNVKGASMNGNCPECGAATRSEGDCITCHHCGWSKC